MTRLSAWLVAHSKSLRGTRPVERGGFRVAALIGLLLASASGLEAQTATLTATWNANSESDIAGYVISYGPQSGTYSSSVDVGNLTTWQGSFGPGRYYFAVKAYNTSQLFSPYSVEVFADVAGPPPLPGITAMNPTSGPVGTSVTITGTNFGSSQGTSAVAFNGTAATATSWSGTRLVAPVPSGATTGNVVVTVGGQVSNGVSFIVSASSGLPAPWVAQDVGGPALAGHTTYASGAFSVTGSGIDIWDVNDQFQFVYQPLNGDGQIVALVSSLQNTDPWAKAGVMIRQDLTGGSPNAMSAVTAGNGMTFQQRVTQGGTSLFNNQGFSGSAPYWVRLVRSGNTFTGYYSATGAAWILMGSMTVPMASNAYVGLAVTSHNPSVVTVAALSNVTVTAGSPPPVPSVTSLTPTSGAVGTAVTIAGTNFGATQGTSRVTFNGTAATPSSWSATSIHVPVPSGATTGNVVVTVGGQASNAVFFTVSSPPPPPPTLTSVNPGAGPVGTSVTITGTNFGSSQGISRVTFNGTAATPSSWSATSIHAPVPSGATTGSVVVTVGGQASNAVPFTVSSPPPTLTGVNPGAGSVGTSVTITGTNFGSSQGTSRVTFNGTAATPSSWSATSIRAAVPGGATTGNVVVTVGGQASNAVPFTVSSPPPTLTGVNPGAGSVGTSVTITGTNFGSSQGTSRVTFNGTAATPSSWSATSIRAPVPTGATTGPVLVTVGGQGSNVVPFTVTQIVVVTATWNANTESDIAGYVLSYGTQTGVYSTSADVGNVTTWQGSLTSGARYYFAVKAYNTSLQFSPYSAEVFFDVIGTGSALTLTQTAPVNQTGAQTATVPLRQAASRQAALASPIMVDPSLVASWQLNEGVGTTAFDASGRGMNGTLVNGPAWTTGRLGGALSFDGIKDHVTTNFVENLRAWTVAAWVLSPAAPSSAAVSGPVQREKNFQLNWNHPDAALRGAVALRAGGTWYAASFGPLAAHTWYHLVGTYDGDTLRAYVNGVLTTANPAPSGHADLESLPLEIGARAGTLSYFAGVVNGVRIYRRAISAAEVAALAQPEATPPTSVDLAASSTGQSVSLAWTPAGDPNSGVGLYRIYRGTIAGGTKRPLAEGLATALGYQDRDTTPFTVYYYEVSAVNGRGVEGPRSNEAIVVTGNPENANDLENRAR